MKLKIVLFFIFISPHCSAQFKSNKIEIKNYSDQSYDVTPSVKWINESRSKRYFITSLFNNQAGGCGVVLSTNAGFSNQVYCSVTNENLNDAIQKYFDKGYHISDVSGGDSSAWSIAFSEQKMKPKQQIIFEDHFPVEKIKEFSDSSYKITTIASNELQWFVTMSVNADIESQDFKREAKIPREYINEFWNKGYSITNVIYSSGMWTIVMSKTKKINLQLYQSDATFPVEWIKENWKKGYRITSAAKGGEWLVVMSSFNEEK